MTLLIILFFLATVYFILKDVFFVTPPPGSVLIISSGNGNRKISYTKCLVSPLDQTYQIISLKPLALTYAFGGYQAIYFDDALKGDIKISFTIKLKNSKENILQAVDLFGGTKQNNEKSYTKNLKVYFRTKSNDIMQETAKKLKLGHIMNGGRQGLEIFHKQIFKNMQRQFECYELLDLNIEEVRLTEKKFMNHNSFIDSKAIEALNQMERQKQRDKQAEQQKNALAEQEVQQRQQQEILREEKQPLRKDTEDKRQAESAVDSQKADQAITEPFEQLEAFDELDEVHETIMQKEESGQTAVAPSEEQQTEQPVNTEEADAKLLPEAPSTALPSGAGGTDLIGQTVLVRSHIVTLTYGESFYDCGSANKTISTRIQGNEQMSLAGGDRAVITGYDPMYDIYFIVKEEEFLEKQNN